MAWIGCLIVGSAVLVWPVVSFRLRGRSAAGNPPRAARLCGWIMAVLLIFFFVCLNQGIFALWRLLAGVPLFAKWLLFVPIVAIPFLAVTAWFSLHAWPRKYWSLAGRIHYSLVAVAGLALLGWLYYWNLLEFHYN